MTFDVQKFRKDFPNLSLKVYGKPLVYLDNAATTFKPQCVIDAVSDHYAQGTSNVHRGVHYLSERATIAFEHSRQIVQQFLNAKTTQEIIFTRGATESINLVAQSFGRPSFKAGDEIVISHMEHHSNIVPWQMLCQQTGCILKIAPINEKGELILDEFIRLLTSRTRLVSMVYVSNSLGTVNPINLIIKEAHERGIPVLVDGAQAVAHQAVDVQALDCDFFVFSGHKIFGPTGIGVLYGKQKLLESMPPYQGGGDMIASVSFVKTAYNVLPYKFEAGTPAIAEAIGLGAALNYVQKVGLEFIIDYKKELLAHGTKILSSIPGVRLIGTAPEKAAILSFVLEGIHPHDLGTIVDQEGVAIRTGHHCTQPVMDFFKVPATARASLSFYNTKEELNILAKSIYRAKEIFHA
ncbi:MAG: cysteine desulfurase [Candidatus Omnitrophica bacterium]|nr:cysteine desulfurase [Candidatus Omnitrophota bacterium]